MQDILNKKEGMEYRRFGRTEKYLSAITLGGMRFLHGWDAPRNKIPEDTLEHCVNTLKLAFDSGINHIETAWGYQKSETVFGKALNEVLFTPRNSYHLMTKGDPKDADTVYEMVENQLRDLQTDYLDFYGWHGINNDELLQLSCKTNGPVEALLKLKEEGIIKHVGFSTHGSCNTITKAIDTNLFDFVNLHYYYFNQQNLRAVQAAQANDMGVFIISPNDKGGQLFKAPEKVCAATAPLSPIQWNSRFCLQHQAIHTLSFGITEPEHFAEMKGIFTREKIWDNEDEQIKKKLDSFVNDDPYAYYEGWDMLDDPSEINIPEMLRLRKLWKCYHMKDFGKYRYKVFEEKSHWFPGLMATKQNVAKVDAAKAPPQIPIKEILSEIHHEFYVPKYTLAKN